MALFAPILGLLFCNVLWSLAYSTSKSMMTTLHPLEIAFLRHFFAFLPLLVLFLLEKKSERQKKMPKLTGHKSDYRLFFIGVLTFFISPVAQMWGLNLSRSIDSSLMIAIEPLMTILLAMLVFKEKMNFRIIFAIFMAICGVLILSETTLEKLLAFNDQRLVGNSVFLVSTFCEAMVSILSKPLMGRRSVVSIMFYSLTIGTLLTFGYNMMFDDASRLSGIAVLFSGVDATVYLKLIFLGFGCTTFAYIYWLRLIPTIPLSIMSLTLYLQPVLGMFWGHLFLGEALTTSSFVGMFVILSAVIVGTSYKKALNPEAHR